jgi:peptidoglycan/LPS O-acetylase OafA/YrhL
LLIVGGAITLTSAIVAHLSFQFIENPIIRWARGRERSNVTAATLSPAAG